VWLTVPALALALFLGRDTFAVMLFKRAVYAQITSDIVSELSEGLHVASCGSGTPLPDLTMAGACTAVIAGGKLLVFDVGEGAPKTLASMGLRPGRIAAVFLTHFHSDHIAGLGSLALQRNLGDQIDTSMRLIGPAGIEQIAAGFNLAFGQDHRYRIAHHTSLSVSPHVFELVADPFDVPEDGILTEVYRDDTTVVRAFRVPHGPVDSAVGYRIEHAGMSVVISGDTEMSDNLARAARDTNLLVHEATNADMLAEIEAAARSDGQHVLTTIMHDVPSYHATPVEAATVAHSAGAQALAFTHMIPPLPKKFLEGPFLRGVEDQFAGPVIVLRDGVLLSLREQGAPAARNLL